MTGKYLEKTGLTRASYSADCTSRAWPRNQSQECLVIPMLGANYKTITEELRKYVLPMGVKILRSAWLVTPTPAHLSAQESEEPRQR